MTALAEPASGDAVSPVVMGDVIRELQRVAELAERSGQPALVAASRRTQSLLARLRDQFVFDVAGPGSPSEITAA